MNLMNNYFINNSAMLGGGGIYFSNKLLTQSPYQNNDFIYNTASFANDFFTFPMRIKLTNYKTLNKKKAYSLTVIPGITQTSLEFDLVDYYGQTIKSINGGLLIPFLLLLLLCLFILIIFEVFYHAS